MSKSVKVLSPYDGSLIEEIPLNDWNEIDGMLETAHQLAADRRKMLPAEKRIAILEKTAELVEGRLEDFALQAAREGGKPLVDSRVELVRAVNGLREAANAISQLPGREIPMGLNPASANRMAYTLREPIGVVIAVSAFNHPFNLIIHQVIPAVAVGAPVVVKPAGTTPISCRNLLECLYEAGLPKEWAQMAMCDRENAEKLVTDSRVAFLTFIGSAKVGWMLRSKVAPGVHCALEHGGAAPVIVEPDADVDTMLPLLAKGGMYHAGQVCVSVQRVFVHESIIEQVAEGLVKLAKKMVVGDPMDEKTEVGPLILESEVERMGKWVEEAKESGGKVLCGGNPMGTTCFEPTVILNPGDDTKVSQEEIFGPIVCLYSYSNRDDAIKRANDVPFSFQASVFTKNLDNALEIMKRFEAKVVMINDHTAFRVDWMPFGGRKVSGLGVGGILPAMEEMTEEKMFVIKSSSL